MRFLRSPFTATDVDDPGPFVAIVRFARDGRILEERLD
jgi:hypothetical protein